MDSEQHHAHEPMGLAIKIRRTYSYINNQDDLDDRFTAFKMINCKYKLFYGNDRGFRVKIGTIEASDEKAFEKSIKRRQSTIGEHILMSSILVESSASKARKLVYTFKDGCVLSVGDFLEIQCYRMNRGLLYGKAFGKYKMLLDLLINNLDEFNLRSKLEIDDFLIDPKSNATLKERISFELVYQGNMHDKNKMMNLDRYHIFKSDANRLRTRLPIKSGSLSDAQSMHSYECTAINFIHTLFEAGHFALITFRLSDNVATTTQPPSSKATTTAKHPVSVLIGTGGDDLAQIQSFLINKAGYSSTMLNLALNLIISYEFQQELKERLKYQLMFDQGIGISGSSSNRRRSTHHHARLVHRHVNVMSAAKHSSVSSSHGGGSGDDDDEEMNAVAHMHGLMQQIFYSDEEKITAWQVRVRIVELKHLIVGVPLGQLVYCIIDAGGKRYRTRDKQIDALNFYDDDEVFIARIEAKEYQKSLNFQIVISVYFKHFFNDTLVGRFCTDFRTVYRQPGHEVYHKWGELFIKNEKPEHDMNSPLMAPNEYSLKGYIKFDIILQSKGDKTKIHYLENLINDSEEIENNIFHPYGLNTPREYIKMTVQIGNVLLLEKHQRQIIDIFKLSIFNANTWFGTTTNSTASSQPQSEHRHDELDEKTPFDPENIIAKSTIFIYVRVTYAGQTKHTHLIPKTNLSKLNDKLDFYFYFPPLVWVMKIELCSGTGSPNDVVLATEYVNLSEISNYRADDDMFYPTYGPRYIDMYSKPNNLRVRKENVDASESEIELHSSIYAPLTADGSFYVARMLLSISSHQAQTHRSRLTSKVTSHSNLHLLGHTKHDHKLDATTDFVAYVVINEATMIDAKFRNDLLSFKLTVGTNGHEKIDNEFKYLNQTQLTRPIQLNASMPLYLPYEKLKPCVCLKFSIQDTSHIMYMINFIEIHLKDLMRHYSNIKEQVWPMRNNRIIAWTLENDTKAQATYKLIATLTVRVKSYLENEYESQHQNLTDFERMRAEQLKRQFSLVHDLVILLLQLLHKFRHSNSNNTFMTYIDIIVKNAFARIKTILRQPLSYFPDLSLWLVASRGSDEQPIGVLHLKASDIIWSSDKKKSGPICCRMVHTDVKSLRECDFVDSEKENISRVRIYAWLRHAADLNVAHVTDILPQDLSESVTLNNKQFSSQLPSQLILSERHTFQLNSYLYQGRDMLLLDIAGESDPFARITLLNQTVQSKTIDNTVNPTWNETLCIPEVYLYGRLEHICHDPPEVIVDIYDEDPFNQKEFMGRVYLKPEINLDPDSKRPPPKLKWHKLYHTYHHAGDILTSFELVYLGQRKLHQNMIQSPIPREIPDTIKPKTRKYTLEIYYWGLRNLTEHGFIVVGQQKTSVKIEIGNQTIDPNVIEKCNAHGNFLITHQKRSIWLPEEDEYKPHLNIRCESFGTLFLYSSLSLEKHLDTIEKTLGRKILFGSCTIKSIGDYCFDNEKLEAYRKKHANRNLVHSISINEQDGSASPQKTPRNRTYITPNRRHRQRPVTQEDLKYVENEKKRDANNEELDLSYMDWWSKYFNSISPTAAATGLANFRSQHHHHHHHLTRRIQLPSFDDDDDDMSSESSSSSSSGRSSKSRRSSKSSKSKTKKKKKKKAKKSKEKKPKKKMKQPKQGINRRTQAAIKNMPKIQIYDHELEKAFDMSETLETFNLIIGKNKPPTAKDDKLQCRFKGKFLLYDEEKLTPDLSTYLNINGGFLKKMPLNSPIKVKCHVYIIKVSIINPIHLIGKLDPYIYIDCGEAIELNERIKTDSIEPLVGRCFEFEARFPTESQLSISIKNWNLLGAGGTELIGKTSIDLEDRFYSLRYASCGLPKKFDTDGYNRWRDCMMPRQLLAKMTRKFGLKKPHYELGGSSDGRARLFIYDIDDIRHEVSSEYVFKKSSGGTTNEVNGGAKDNDSDIFNDESSDADLYIEESDEETNTAPNQGGGGGGFGGGGGGAETGSGTDTEIQLANDVNATGDSANSYIRKKRRFRVMPRADRKLEQLALNALNDWEKYTKVALVPEHIETRSLYNPEAGLDLEQGKIQMWVDMFLLEDYHHASTSQSAVGRDHEYFAPVPVDVSLRKPKKLQLRVIVYNTKDVILDDVNYVTGERKSDIYVKGFLGPDTPIQKTDVHYRSLDGEGNFNWRFIFDFDYLPQERRIVISSNRVGKRIPGFVISSQSTERKSKPVLTLLCYDADQFSADDLLGRLDLDLGRLLKGTSSPDKCTLKMIQNRHWPTIDLFKARQIRGWWPFTNENQSELTGKVELEIKLLSENQALERPAGLGRSGPEPLPDPQRPETSFLWFVQPMRTFRYIIWKNYWKQIIFLAIGGLLLIGVIIFFIQLPNAIITKIIG